MNRKFFTAENRLRVPNYINLVTTCIGIFCENFTFCEIWHVQKGVKSRKKSYSGIEGRNWRGTSDGRGVLGAGKGSFFVICVDYTSQVNALI